MTGKKCIKCCCCREIKPLTEFCHRKAATDGYTGQCKSCDKAKREVDSDKIKARRIKYNKTHSEQNRKYSEEYRKKNPNHAEEYRLKNKEKIKDSSIKYRAENYEKIEVRQKKYRDVNKQKIRIASGKYYKQNRAKIRDQSLFREYGLEKGRYEEMLIEQNNVCAICGLAETATVSKKSAQLKMLAIDHDHETGKVRGLLCRRCNKAIGLLREDLGIFASAISYLQNNNLRTRRTA